MQGRGALLCGACRLKLGALVVALIVAVLASAPQARVPKPTHEFPAGERCVEDTEFMRRNHMELLKHHRDKTVREGIRTKQHSLANCIDCHAGKLRSVSAPAGFCEGCHAYVGVTLDCFECHSTKPRSAAVAGERK